MSLSRLAYVSTARPGLTDADLEAILEAARARNARQEITGLLVYNGLNFLQVLEGPGANLIGVFDSICRDARHEGVVRVLAEADAERAFSRWSMGFARIAPPEGGPGESAFVLSEAALGEHLGKDVPDRVRALFTGFNTMRPGPG